MSEETFKLTADHIKSATTYIPLAKKYALIMQAVPQCIKACELEEKDFNIAYYKKDFISKQLTIGAMLCKQYLKVANKDADNEFDVEFTPLEYDFYMKEDLLVQIENILPKPATKEYNAMCADRYILILKLPELIKRDINDFEQLLDNEIEQELNRLNSIQNIITDEFIDMASNKLFHGLTNKIADFVTPENIEKMTQALNVKDGELKKFIHEALLPDDEFNYDKNDPSARKRKKSIKKENNLETPTE